MRMNRYLSQKIQPELDELKKQLNLTGIEEKVFDDLAKGRSNVEISYKEHICEATVSNRIHDIRKKIERLEGDTLGDK